MNVADVRVCAVLEIGREPDCSPVREMDLSVMKFCFMSIKKLSSSFQIFQVSQTVQCQMRDVNKP